MTLSVLLFSVWVTYAVTYIMYGQLTWVLLKTRNLGKLARQTFSEKTKRQHRLLSIFFIFDTVASMLIVRWTGQSDDMIYIPDPILKLHIYSFYLFFGCSIISAISAIFMKGSRYRKFHKILGITIFIGFFVTVGTGIAFTHFFGKTKIISSLLIK